MKNAFSKMMLVLIMFLVSINFSYAEDVEKTFKVNKQSALDVRVKYGNVNIFTWDKDEVKVVARNVDTEELDNVTIEQKASGVIVEFTGRDSEKFLVDAWVPVQFNVNVSTGGGNVKINDFLAGRAVISTSGGNISTAKLKGNAEISTGGGNISCADIEGDIEVSSGGGDIKLAMVTGTAEVATAGGNVTVGKVNKSAEIATAGGNINVGDVGESAEIATAGGNINVGYINGTAEINTGGGNINISGSKGKVEVNTGGGNIELKNIGGGIEANTGAGKVRLELANDIKFNSSVSTSAGDIVLIAPGNLKATIIAKVKAPFIDKSDKSYIHIKSDFDGLTYDVDDTRREIVATLEINGGGPKIELNTHLGKIEIKKK
jgi:hypothetical protein